VIRRRRQDFLYQPEVPGVSYAVVSKESFWIFIECDVGDDHLRKSVHFFGLVGGMRVCEFYAT
jgi:hypothetical protein